MPRQLLMMEAEDRFITMDTVRRKGHVRIWRVLPDGRIAPESPVMRADLPQETDDVTPDEDAR